MDRIVCGATTSLSGRYAPLGGESFQGLSLWIKDVNARGGIRGLPVELIHYDDESDPKRVRMCYERLIAGQGVDVLIGPYSSGLTLVALEVAEKYGRTLWNYGGATDEIVDRGSGHVISAITPSSRYMTGIISLVTELDPGATRLAVLYAEDSGFSRNVAGGAVRFGGEQGFAVSEFTFRSGERDFSDILDGVEAFHPDLLLCVGRVDDDLAIASQIVGRRLRARAIGVVAAGLDLFRGTLGENAFGFLAPSHWEPGLRVPPDYGPTAEEFVSSFQDTYGRHPGFLAAQAYNIGLVIEQSALRAKSIEGERLRQAALGLRFKTFYGEFGVDPSTGEQREHQMLTLQWQRDNKVIVYPPNLRESPPIYPLELGLKD